MMLQGGVATALVVVLKGARYATWSTEKLRQAMHKSRGLENAFVARFGQDLADKVRHSVPVPSPTEAEVMAMTDADRENSKKARACVSSHDHVVLPV